MFGKKKAAPAGPTTAPVSQQNSDLYPTDMRPPEFKPSGEPESAPAPSFGIVAPVITQREGSPSLFVKIDKYTDIQERLQELRYNTTNMRNILDKLSESQKKLQLSLSLSYNTLEKMSQTLEFLDAKFSGRVMRTPESPYGRVDQPPSPPRSQPGVDDDLQGYLKGINSQVERIRTDLKTVR